MTCGYCQEPIEPGEESPLENVHRECGIRLVMGSSAHQLKTCGCYGGTDNERTSGITLRQSALQAEATFEMLQGKKVWVN
jgi:histidinol phosphatase-like PHP family hydrolase